MDHLVSLRQAVETLKVDRMYLHGFIAGRRIPVQKIGTAIAISQQDLDRLDREMPRPEGPRKRKRRRSLAGTAAG